jgi:hypothetical protein
MQRYLLAGVCCVVAVVATLTAQSNTPPFRDGRSICVPYKPDDLRLSPRSDGVWQLQRGDGAIFKVFDNREDADAGLAIAMEHTQLCYIGKDNKRPQRERFIMEYWKK